jgi:hypothetical protein
MRAAVLLLVLALGACGTTDRQPAGAWPPSGSGTNPDL